MPILRAVCPECRAGIKTPNPAGFTPGETIECPKCGTYFAVEGAPAARPAPAKPVAAKPARPRVTDDEDEPPRPKAKARVADDEDDDDRPRKRRRRDEDDDRPRRKESEGGGYRTSPLRFIILGVLIVVMLVLGYMLYQKWQREKQEAVIPAARTTDAV